MSKPKLHPEPPISSLNGNPVNLLLSKLTLLEQGGIETFLQPANLELSQVLFHPDDHIDRVYFPTTSIVSLLTELQDGSGVEVGLVGREGMVGISAILGGPETKVATVQAAGAAFTMSADKVREAFRGQPAFQISALRYTHALMTQISQSVVCNVRHAIEGRLARWLLMYSDRLDRKEFELTQEFMANMLGVRRASVTEVAVRLQEHGLIEYSRGRVKIIDREGLEKFACECYAVVKEKYDDLFLKVDPALTF